MGNQTDSPLAQRSAAVDILAMLALALQEAHDIGHHPSETSSPCNIMINRHREMIIMDFGLANGRRRRRQTHHPDRPRPAGTAALHRAPEQAAGERGRCKPVPPTSTALASDPPRVADRPSPRSKVSWSTGDRPGRTSKPPRSALAISTRAVQPRLSKIICLKAIASGPEGPHTRRWPNSPTRR